MKRIGLIINPIAGMGGRVGLKGTDGLADEAIRRGASPRAAKRTELAIAPLAALADKVFFLVASGQMGEAVITGKHVGYTTIYNADNPNSTAAADTISCARQMVQEGVDLILFAGGDGTARDMYRAVGEEVPVIGIPAGVKIHSPVFAQTPAKAGELAHQFIEGKLARLAPTEVLDIDEGLYRKGKVNTRLFGYLSAPQERTAMQNRKAGSTLSEHATQNTISLDIIDRMEPGVFYLIGPGSTTRPILENLGQKGTLLGIDIIRDRKLVASDASETTILEIVKDRPFRIVITPIGGQGYLFGRGNHQLSPEVIRRAGKDNILVIATMEKITRLKGEPLLVDTGEEDTDRLLAGYTRVITGYNEELVCKIR